MGAHAVGLRVDHGTATLQAATVRQISQMYEPGGSTVGWEFLMEVTAGVALSIARVSRLDVQPMVL